MYGLSFMVKKWGEKKFFEYIFESGNPFKLNNELQRIINERNLLLADFDRVNIIHHNRLNTLVPQTLFKPEAASVWLRQNVRLLADDTVSYEPADIIKAVNVYVPFSPLKIAIDTQKIHQTHTAGVFFDNISALQSKQLQLPVFEIYLNIFPKDFQIAVFKNEVLQVYNHFDYETVDEFLYYLFFVLETIQINESKSHIYVMGKESTDELIESLKTFTKHISVLPAKTPSQINNYI